MCIHIILCIVNSQSYSHVQGSNLNISGNCTDHISKNKTGVGRLYSDTESDPTVKIEVV
jgi:hypothetical protein